MKRLSAILFILAFFTGSFLFPAIHQATCADDHAASEADNCALCHITHTPIQAASNTPTFLESVRLIDSIAASVPFFVRSSSRTPTQPRAPPA